MEAKAVRTAKGRQVTTSEVEAITTGGLLLSGECIGRKRRKMALKDGGSRYVITLTLLGGGQMHNVDRWCDTAQPNDLPAIGEEVLLPVKLRHFTTKSGQSMSRLEFGPGSDGEDF
jgi:hypothetical protein